MAYILGLLVIAFFFLALHYFTELSLKQKSVITAVVLSLVLGALSFNMYSQKEQAKMMKVVTKFNQKRSVHCDGVEVNSTNYTLSIGTYTFIGKENTPFYAQMISASECE